MSLEARGVEVWRGRGRALGPVSLNLVPGEVLAVVGPNGAGKSTLLSAFSGELPCTVGEVLLDGRPLLKWPPRERALRLGVLPQESSLGFGFTVLEVALLGRSPHATRGEGSADMDAAQAALEVMDIRHLSSRPYTSLSGGERQRVQLARVLAQLWEAPEHGHRYLLLDEPTSSLDLSHQHLVLEEATHFARDGGAVLAVLHDLNLAARYAHRIAVLADGKLVELGSPAQVLRPELIASTFGLQVRVVEYPDSPAPFIIPSGRAPHHP
ncbi:heme ABC transporter ATP-binding protein [Myxococcus sp. CA051A]|uniref:heme ABC transporter ATP-binding protein n=1 Tax=unclassified Myxococcus TaxID=2648731 RepID=UPI00157A60B4|nr:MULTISPECIES: heme ABC transporter ATP-binding protein [unclassified Myxococcus]NTX15404.1 heme ABC transporter ATP-binding protein [Myxococcus sp. CA056]NTX52562.1 heme ABC transporter ATP-binding protein [Myxococcus sp. CA039A]NTX61492.1 heme ABC transporter ATP-binding protein [Myxococcus sp. CA051A]